MNSVTLWKEKLIRMTKLCLKYVQKLAVGHKKHPGRDRIPPHAAGRPDLSSIDQNAKYEGSGETPKWWVQPSDDRIGASIHTRDNAIGKQARRNRYKTQKSHDNTLQKKHDRSGRAKESKVRFGHVTHVLARREWSADWVDDQRGNKFQLFSTAHSGS